MGLAARSGAEFVLGRATEDKRLLASAHEGLERMITGTAEEYRERMRSLPWRARILDGTSPS